MPRAGLSAGSVTEAAARIVDAEGIQALSLSRVAADLGVAAPSLYKHVRGLDDLFVRLTALAVGLMADRLIAAALGRAGRRGLVAIAGAYREFAVGHSGLYSLIQKAPRMESPDLDAQKARAVGVIVAVVEGYDVPDALSTHATRMIRAALHGFVDIEILGGFQMPSPVDESFALLVDTLDVSLGALGSTRREDGWCGAAWPPVDGG